MPRQIDLRPTNKVANNPNNQIAATPDQIANYFAELPALIAKAFETAILEILQEIDALTGLNLVGFAEDLKKIFSGDILGGLLGMITGNNSQIVAFIEGLGGMVIADIVGLIKTIITDVSNVPRLIESGIAQAVSSIQALLSQILRAIAKAVGGIFSIPGDILSNIETDVESFLRRFPGLNIIGGLRPTTTPVVPASHIAVVNPELLWDPGYDSAATVSAYTDRISWDGTVGRSDPIGSLLIAPDGLFSYGEVSNPVPVVPGDQVAVSIFSMWNGLVYSGTGPIQMQLMLAANGAPVGQVALGIFAQPGRDQNTWLQLSQVYTVPATGVDTVYLLPFVDSTATAGQVWFDDGSVKKVTTIPAAALGTVPPTSVGGIQGIEDIGTAVANVVDGLISAFEGVFSTGNPVSALHGVAQSTATKAATAALQAAEVANILSIQNNASVAAGLESTVESNMSIQSLGNGATPNLVSITQAASGGTFIRIKQAKVLGFHQWWGYYTGTVTAIYLNFGVIPVGSTSVTPLFSSANLVGSIPSTAGTAAWNLYNFPGVNEFAVNPGDVVMVELQMVGAGTVHMAGNGQSWQTNHPTATTAQSAFTRNTGSGAAVALSGSFTNTGATPYAGVGVSNLPVDYEPPDVASWNVAGSYPVTIPPWMNSGDLIDAVTLDAGSGAPSATEFLPNVGAKAGVWTGRTYVYGVDIPLTTHTLTATVGQGGAPGISWLLGSPGNPGGASSVSGTGMTTQSGPGTTGNNTSTQGASPGNFTFNNVPYAGGTAVAGTLVGSGHPGSSPGGGGGGAGAYGEGGVGADGFVSVGFRQGAPITSTAPNAPALAFVSSTPSSITVLPS